MLITGITGQAGSYLAESLLADGHEVFGLVRRSSVYSLSRLPVGAKGLTLLAGDLLDMGSLWGAIEESRPRVIYNLAAQSFVGCSFGEPGHTMDVTGKGFLNLLEVARQSRHTRDGGCTIFQASTSEMFGSSATVPPDGDEPYQNEETPFSPNSPYAVAKAAAYQLGRIYREAHGLDVRTGVMFNFESPRRGGEFVTQKIARHVAAFAAGSGGDGVLKLGNLGARRDWSHARDAVRAMRMMAERGSPLRYDYVVSSGETRTVGEFLSAACRAAGVEEKDLPVEKGCPAFMRPCEVPYLRGDSTKIRRDLGWAPVYSFDGLVAEMVRGERRHGNCC